MSICQTVAVTIAFTSPESHMKSIALKLDTDPTVPFALGEATAKLLDEEALIRKVFEKDPQEGCELLFRKYFAALCNHAVRFVYAREVAEDIVAEVFCRFWTNQMYLNINTSYRAYLFKAVRHAAYNYVRWELSKKADGLAFDWDAVPASTDPVAIMQYDELYQTIDQTIHSLPPQCKRMFLMSRFENKKYQEIAAELQVSVKAVEAQITKALCLLRKALNDTLL